MKEGNTGKSPFRSRQSLARCLLLVLFSVASVSSFTTEFPRNGVIGDRSSTTIRWARKQQSKKKSNTPAGSTGGFGSVSKTNPLEGKTRSVSKHSGSGTKPLRQAANNFDDLRKEYGGECVSDLYCRSPLNDPELLWFLGKVAVRPNTSATAEQAVISQKRLILEYAKRELRPQNLGGKYANSLELWLAPGDSEMDAVQNKISLNPIAGSTADLAEDFRVVDVGYNPEIYVQDERAQGGLRIKRDSQGHPVKPVFEVNQSL